MGVCIHKVSSGARTVRMQHGTYVCMHSSWSADKGEIIHFIKYHAISCMEPSSAYHARHLENIALGHRCLDYLATEKVNSSALALCG